MVAQLEEQRQEHEVVGFKSKSKRLTSSQGKQVIIRIQKHISTSLKTQTLLSPVITMTRIPASQHS